MTEVYMMPHSSDSESDYDVPEIDEEGKRLFTYSGPALGPTPPIAYRSHLLRLGAESRRNYIRLRKPLAILEHLAAMPESAIPDEQTFVRLYNLFDDGIIKFKLKNPIPPELDEEMQRARKSYIDTCNLMCGMTTGFDYRKASLATRITEVTSDDEAVTEMAAEEYAERYDSELEDYHDLWIQVYQFPICDPEKAYRFLLSLRGDWVGFLFKYFRYFRNGDGLPDFDELAFRHLPEWARLKEKAFMKRAREEYEEELGESEEELKVPEDSDEEEDGFGSYVPHIHYSGFAQFVPALPTNEDIDARLSGINLRGSDNPIPEDSNRGGTGNRGRGHRGRGRGHRGGWRGRGRGRGRNNGGNTLRGDVTPPPRFNNSRPSRTWSDALVSPE